MAKPTSFEPDEGGGGSGKQIGDALMTIVAVLWKTIPGGVAGKIVLSVVAWLFTWASSIYITGIRVTHKLTLVNNTLGTQINAVNETLSEVNKTLSDQLAKINVKMDNQPNKTELFVFGCFLVCVPWLTRHLPYKIRSPFQAVPKSDTAHSPVAQPDSPAPPVP